MAALYIAAGVNHFVNPDFYLSIMPPYLPWHDALVALSGVAEVICGVGLLIPRTRAPAAWATIALLVAVFPANLHMAIADVPMGSPPQSTGLLRWIRLPVQLVLVAWAWWYTRPEALGASGEEG
ncbi:MAG: MauE/DoxX family redox-associated membrane protein [Sandaracinaceae bacterium]